MPTLIEIRLLPKDGEEETIVLDGLGAQVYSVTFDTTKEALYNQLFGNEWQNNLKGILATVKSISVDPLFFSWYGGMEIYSHTSASVNYNFQFNIGVRTLEDFRINFDADNDTENIFTLLSKSHATLESTFYFSKGENNNLSIYGDIFSNVPENLHWVMKEDHTIEVIWLDGKFYINDGEIEIPAGNLEVVERYTPHHVSVTYTEGISQVHGEGDYIENEHVLIEAVLMEGYSFDGWYKDGEQVSTELSYEFVMPDEDVSYEARASLTPYVVPEHLGVLGMGKLIYHDDNKIDAPATLPTTAGNYRLRVTIAENGEPTYTWVAE